MPQHLCRLEQLESLEILSVDAEFEGETESLLLVLRAGRVAAFLNICPHAGRRLDFAPGKFLIESGLLVCAAHGASFELPSGSCIAGPCRGQSLREVPVRVENGDVLLD